MDWTIRYRGALRGALDEVAQARVRRALDAEGSRLIGLVFEPDAGSVFRGEAVVDPRRDHLAVHELLAALNDLEARLPGLTVLASDSLGLLGRDETGRLVVHVDEDEADEELEDEEDEDDPGFLADEIYGGVDPAFAPFQGYDPPEPLGPRVPVELQAEGGAGAFALGSAEAFVRATAKGDGLVVTIATDLTLTADALCHAVDADVALVGAAGEVVASALLPLGQDVNRRLECWLDVPIDPARAALVRTVEVGVDAYHRTEHELARWWPGRTATLDAGPLCDVACAFGPTDWPVGSFDVTGRIRNTSPWYLAEVELYLDVFDRRDRPLTDDQEDLGMIGPGESRPFTLRAALDEGDRPRSALLRARLVARRRDLVLTGTIGPLRR